MSDFRLSGIELLQKQLEQWTRETGDYPRRFVFREGLFNRLCAEVAEYTMRRDESILSIVESFKVRFQFGEVLIERAAAEKLP